MPQFSYKARNELGKSIAGLVEAESQIAAARVLISRGMTPVSIQKAAINTDVMQDFNQWQALNALGLTDLILFTRQMYSLSKAGVPIIRAIQSLKTSTRNKALASALGDITKSLESGLALSQALAKHPRIFDTLFRSIIAVGESSGSVDQAFYQISQYLEREKETQSRIKSAIRYPIMVIVAIAIALTIVNIYVIPAFKGVFDKINAELPWQTTLLINTSDFSVAYWPYILAALVVSMVTFKAYLHSVTGRLRWDQFILKIPLIGSIISRATMERFSRSFAMILSSGVPLISGINIVAGAVGNTFVGSKLKQMGVGIERGDTISRMAMATQLFPALVIQMIMVGEETGNISDMLLEVADFYEAEVDAEVKNLAVAIEPILLSVIGAMVLVLALGIFLPMWNLSSAMK
ncbi:MAG: type II secretion system F family protein [Methyloprofundus sp.]|nr:type II secretion system F family protein [Methyloprofundus sp.]MDT8426567.1 type II secretion system F family protein [Methyloprofundus sp.]